jgi:hypothetical protein
VLNISNTHFGTRLSYLKLAATLNELGVVYDIPELNLLSGHYSLEIWLIDTTSAHVYDSMQSCCEFKVRQPGTEVGVTYIEHQWSAPL